MLTQRELADMRATQAAAMMDTCTLRSWSPTVDDYGTEVEGWTERTDVPCGLDTSRAGREVRRVDGTVAVIDAALRLTMADGAMLSPEDAITVTRRNGEPVTLAYGIAGPVQRGPTGVVVQLQAVR